MIPNDLKAGLEQTPKSHVKTVASVQHSACFLHWDKKYDCLKISVSMESYF
jgi:hypothetical protein